MAEFPWAVVRPMGEAVSAKGEVVPPGPMEELLAGFPVTAVRLMGDAVPAGVMPEGEICIVGDKYAYQLAILCSLYV